MELLSEEKIFQYLQSSRWQYQDQALVQDFQFEDFQAAMSFINSVANVAEDLNHHPDIFLHGWCHVRLTVSTHSAGGVTNADLQFVDQVASEIP